MKTADQVVLVQDRDVDESEGENDAVGTRVSIILTRKRANKCMGSTADKYNRNYQLVDDDSQ